MVEAEVEFFVGTHLEWRLAAMTVSRKSFPEQDWGPGDIHYSHLRLFSRFHQTIEILNLRFLRCVRYLAGGGPLARAPGPAREEVPQ